MSVYQMGCKAEWRGNWLVLCNTSRFSSAAE